jgi:hypothetical protein
MNKLEPCPFCDSEAAAVTFKDFTPARRVYGCPECKVFFDTAGKWNQRRARNHDLGTANKTRQYRVIMKKPHLDSDSIEMDIDSISQMIDWDVFFVELYKDQRWTKVYPKIAVKKAQ